MSSSCARAPFRRATASARCAAALVPIFALALLLGEAAAAPIEKKVSILRSDGSAGGATVEPTVVDFESVTTIEVTIGGTTGGSSGGSVAGTGGGPFCDPGTVVVTHTDASYLPGQYVLQAGFAEDEIFAAEYKLTPEDFPLTLRQVDFMFGDAGTTVATTTQFTLIIYDGPPLLNQQVAHFSSPDDFPPIELPAGGPSGVQVRVRIDPSDPDQVIIPNSTGSDSFSIGVRIDSLNNPPVDPCTTPPDQLTNAFPVTDTSGVADPAGNWINALTCSGGPCAGWHTFEIFAGICSPTGDWVMQACYDAQPLYGACCTSSLGCQNDMADSVCADLNGVFFENALCGDITCPDPTGACCALGTCLNDRTAQQCADLADSTYLGNGSTCGGLGGCCMPDGSCHAAFSGCCIADGGTFQGEGTTCDSVSCPQPTGACCFDFGCLEGLLQENCEAGGTGVWAGPFTTCTPDPCVIAIEASSPAQGAIDARQPTDLAGGNAAGWDSVTLTFSGDTAGLTASDFTLTSGGATAPNVIGVTPNGTSATLTFDTFIPPGEWTRITHDPSGTSVCLGYLPGDANSDQTSDPSDILAVIDCINQVAVPPCELYQCDIDRDGECGPPDIIRVIDLLNGAGAYAPWFGVSLPLSPCIP